jgi:membrane protein
MKRVGAITKRTLLAFYNDQMTQHAAALTYYVLMSLFPAVLLALSLLGLVGQYPQTYDAIIGYLRNVVPDSAIVPLDRSLRAALRSEGTAFTTLGIGIVFALYGTTGALEAMRRAFNVVLEADGGRSFLRRKVIDVMSTFVLMLLVLVSLVMVFVGGGFAADLLGFLGLGPRIAHIWSIVRWPGALAVAMFVFAFLYYVTPDVKQRSYRAVLPGAALGVLLWLLASYGFATYISKIADVGAIYGAFTGAIVLVIWLWLTSVALLFGAELNAEIEREHELDEGVPLEETLNRPTRRRLTRPTHDAD